jgi:hypothetical protein
MIMNVFNYNTLTK